MKIKLERFENSNDLASFVVLDDSENIKVELDFDYSYVIVHMVTKEGNTEKHNTLAVTNREAYMLALALLEKLDLKEI